MFKKILFVLTILGTIAAIVVSVFLVMTINQKKSLESQVSSLTAQLETIGTLGDAYTIKAGLNLKAGDAITPTDLETLKITTKGVDMDNVITDPEELSGKYYKIAIKPGTYLTRDMIMSDPISKIMYERDLTFDFLPIGLEKGDYVDIRMVLPLGEEFMVIPHKRVEYMLDRTLKFKFNEEELTLWTSALTDMALYRDRGMKLYITKYLEPGIQGPALPNYPIRADMEIIAYLNNNITNKERVINNELRKALDARVEAVTDELASKAAAGVQAEATPLVQAMEKYIEAKLAGETEGSITPTIDKSSVEDDSNLSTLDKKASEVSDKLEDLGNKASENTPRPSTDNNSVTDKERDTATGGNLSTVGNEIE